MNTEDVFGGLLLCPDHILWRYGNYLGISPGLPKEALKNIELHYLQ